MAAGRDADKIINEDALQNADQDACKNLQKRIANAKSVTKSANLTSESLQEKCTHLQREIQRYLYLSIVKLREREGQGVDPGRSLKGHLWMVDGGWWISFP